jgi:hypothetical protein
MKSSVTSIFVLVCSLLSLSAQAQKCKYDFDKVDPMSNDRVRRNTYTLKEFFIVGIYRKADDFRFELNVRFAGERNFKIRAGDKIEIKLATGTILTLAAAQDASPVSYVATHQIYTRYAITYAISKEEMQQMGEGGFTVVKAKLGDDEVVYEASAKVTEKSAAGAKCIVMD